MCVVASWERLMDEVSMFVLAPHQHGALRRATDVSDGRRNIADAVSDPAVVAVVRRRAVNAKCVMQ